MTLNLLLWLADILNRVDNIVFAFLLIFILGTVSSICDDKSPEDKKDKNVKFCFRWVLFLSLILCLIPSKQTMYLMMGNSYLSQTNLPSKVVSALELKLDDVIKDLKKDKDK